MPDENNLSDVLAAASARDIADAEKRKFEASIADEARAKLTGLNPSPFDRPSLAVPNLIVPADVQRGVQRVDQQPSVALEMSTALSLLEDAYAELAKASDQLTGFHGDLEMTSAGAAGQSVSSQLRADIRRIGAIATAVAKVAKHVTSF